MAVDLFLWPMLIPLLIPLVYCLLRKRKTLLKVLAIAVSGFLIVLIYSTAVSVDYYLGKVLVFIVLPVVILAFAFHKSGFLQPARYGISGKGLGRSVRLFLIFLPLMIFVNYAVFLATNQSGGSDFLTATALFFEAFTEEFFFRGVLFLVLLSLTELRIAYLTSFLSFVLIHPQYYMHGLQLPLAVTIVQSLLTIEIARRSGNMIGSWLLHGANRFSTYAFGLI